MKFNTSLCVLLLPVLLFSSYALAAIPRSHKPRTSSPKSPLLHTVSRADTRTYDITSGDFTCALNNDQAQKAASPGWSYTHIAPSTAKQPLNLAWEPLLEAEPNCNALSTGFVKKFSFVVVLDKSWNNYYAANAQFFSNQGYGSLETSPYVLIDRVTYLFEKQFGVRIAASRVVSLPNLEEACATNNKYADDGTAATSTLQQLSAAGISTASTDAGIIRLGVGSVAGDVYCHSYAGIGVMCNRNAITTNMQKPFDSSGKLLYKAPQVLAHELGHAFGVCPGNTAHCLNSHTANEIPDIMVYNGGPIKAERSEGMFYKFLTACTPIYRDTLCSTVQGASSSCAATVGPPTLAGDYFCTKYEGRSNNWHYVTVTETTANKVYTWKNRAKKSWTLTRDDADPELFHVSTSCPYYSSGYTTAAVRSEVVNGEPKVTGIYGPWNELYELQ